jgi:hypothetical protein
LAVAASASLMIASLTGCGGTTSGSTLHGGRRGDQGFGRGCNSRQVGIETPTADATATGQEGRGIGRGQGWGRTRLASFNQVGRGCDKSSGGCRDSGECSTGEGSCKSDCGGCSEATGSDESQGTEATVSFCMDAPQ